jgi:hypothetical protein
MLLTLYPIVAAEPPLIVGLGCGQRAADCCPAAGGAVKAAAVLAPAASGGGGSD